MFHTPEFYPNFSLKLASVLEEIGVNEKMILKKRTWLLHETLKNISNRLCCVNSSYHNFGGQTEGTTTPGLHSDTDILLCYHDFCVIQDWKEWELGLDNLLMIQEETTPPGYCMLQQLSFDAPTAVTGIHDEHHVRYKDKVLLKNTSVNEFYHGEVRNGPAGTNQTEGFLDQDTVFAVPIKTLPEFLRTWLQQELQQGRLSQDMKTYIESNLCYVTPVGRKNSSFEKAEWRISTSHAERCLMLSLNITQLQCYIMLKLLLKTYLLHPQEKALSSFMCKNILLQCKRKTLPRKWCPQNLLCVFTLVLLQLKQCVFSKYFPHFIIHENNLMAQKFTEEVKRWLLDKIQFLFETHCSAFLELEIDEIGNRLQSRLNSPRHGINRDIPQNQAELMTDAASKLMTLAHTVSVEHKYLLQEIIDKNNFIGIITTLVQLNNHGDHLKQAASRLLTPLICSSLGSVIASRDIYQDHSISQEALTWLSLGQSSDVASSRLKLASVYYCAGNFNRTEIILRSIEQLYDPNLTVDACECYERGGHSVPPRFLHYANTHNALAIQHTVALCVRFIPDEVHCKPRELQYEMFRSTQEEREHRNESIDFWMDWAVIDSLPFLFFLKYKTYGHLQRFDEQQQALNNLARSIHTTDNFKHKETALNLLGQCYKQENRYTEALQCFVNSINIRPTNNAARLHICTLLYAIYRNTN